MGNMLPKIIHTIAPGAFLLKKQCFNSIVIFISHTFLSALWSLRCPQTLNEGGEENAVSTQDKSLCVSLFGS